MDVASGLDAKQPENSSCAADAPCRDLALPACPGFLWLAFLGAIFSWLALILLLSGSGLRLSLCRLRISVLFRAIRGLVPVHLPA